jgi:putative lipoprotein
VKGGTLRTALAWTCLVLGTGCASFRHGDDAWWGSDKARHFFLSAALGAGTSYLWAAEGADRGEALAVGVASAAAAGAAKESSDLRKKGTYFSGKDFAWDLLGGLAGGFVGAAAAGE